MNKEFHGIMKMHTITAHYVFVSLVKFFTMLLLIVIIISNTVLFYFIILLLFYLLLIELLQKNY